MKDFVLAMVLGPLGFAVLYVWFFFLGLTSIRIAKKRQAWLND